MAAMLFTGAKQQLHAKTDPKQRLLSSGYLFDDKIQTILPQMPHRIAKCTDTWQNDTISSENLLGITRHYTLITETFYRLTHTVQVAHAIIDDCNSHPTALPS
ncbi:hypothetical protein D3C75_585020 [compost metagenome]